MKNTQRKSLITQNFDVTILIVVSALCVAGAFFSLFHKFDYRLYDIMLGMTGRVEEDQNILLVDIDDRSIDDIGVWPWSRDIVAGLLVRLREFGAKTIVFDIEYLQKSAKALVPDAQLQTEETIEMTRQNITNVLGQFAQAAGSGMYSPGEIDEMSGQLVDGYINPAINDIKRAVDNQVRDNDMYFAESLQFFGNSWMTLNVGMVSDLDGKDTLQNPLDEELAVMDARRYAVSRFLLDQVTDTKGLVEQGNLRNSREQNSYRGFTPARHEFISRCAGLGATNVIVDKDGTRRRIELLHHPDPEKKFLWRNDGGYHAEALDPRWYVPQLAFGPLLQYLDVQSLERTGSRLILHGARRPDDAGRYDISIPLDASGCMLINWLKKDYDESFRRHVSVLFLYELDQCEKRIGRNLSNLLRYQLMDDDGVDLPYYTVSAQLLALYNNICVRRDELLSSCKGYDESGNLIGGILPQEYENFFAQRALFHEQLREFVKAPYMHECSSRLDSFDDGTNTDYIEAVKAEMTGYFTGLAEDCGNYQAYYDDLAPRIKDSFCLIGNCATASTDLGVTPFTRRYANLGTHANVANTILQQDFITPVPVGWGLAFAFCFTLAVLLCTRKLSSAKKNVAGLLYLLGPAAVIVLLMLMFKIYIPLFFPLLLAAVTYLSELAMNFIAVEKDKNTLRRGFDAYVAPEVVSQIVKNPNLLGLGGVNKHITALFSDVKSFSAFTEMINNEAGEAHGAERLVAILNDYLGDLSDAIYANRGTIDKYVGDEIVSFFGAPVDNPYNAFDACVAGIRMKQVEAEYNKKHFDELHDVPMPLESRVGLNTGDMVVGNMGTAKKLNYTIMGNNVNLASRLEGTNKAYRSWIMCSESTWNDADQGEKKGLLVSRRFDCVRVINVKKPVAIYNIIGLRNELPAAQIEAAEIFNRGMELYLKGSAEPEAPKDIADIKMALEFYRQAKACWPGDESSDVFIERCESFIASGLPERWDGVYTMTSK